MFSGSQQPLRSLPSAARDGVAIVIDMALAEDTKIELRGGVAALGSKKKLLYDVGGISATCSPMEYFVRTGIAEWVQQF